MGATSRRLCLAEGRTFSFDHNINSQNKKLMVHRKGFYYSLITLVQIRFIQPKQFNETNVTLHNFQKNSDLKIFLNASAGT